MNLYLNKLKYYFLTTGKHENRKQHILKIFDKYDITEINPILNIEKYKSGSIGISRIIDQGLRNQDISKPFQPFVIIEDDISFYKDFPDYIKIPNNTDLLYIGLSIWGLNIGKERGEHNNIIFDDINDDIFRIYNMLSTHGIIICSPLGALTYQKSIMESYYYGVVWDVILAKSQPYINVYALKNPLVYQDPLYGGNNTTQINFKYLKNNKKPDIFDNKYLTIKMIKK